ncbi:hypothetical protein N7517_000783 [Penicillium concentricum]|uniref:Uncharacterized protein n=1 Tax=Penicillium concentricum TaxID=293559 RepID=A0A9W9VI86_9EURO|nr:uncharacterized protein N7517_000783 [Penicillium concentricum]KAJ5382872.1 hypothetical protein N7517_000783 [Penicillium concentricum]
MPLVDTENAFEAEASRSEALATIRSEQTRLQREIFLAYGAERQLRASKIVSRQQQARVTTVGQLLYIDLHPVKPKGISKEGKNDREYALIITDDATRFRAMICIAKKSDSSPTLQKWTKQFKDRTGYYPTEWRLNNAKGPSVPYAHEQNGVAEYSGHYIMQIARTMHIDAKARSQYRYLHHKSTDSLRGIYNPRTKKVSIHRDVVFWEPRSPQTYDGTSDIQIGEEIIDGPPPKKVEFSVGEPLFKSIRKAAESLAKKPDDQQHVSPGEEHFSEAGSIDTDEAELFYNTQEGTLEERLEAT